MGRRHLEATQGFAVLEQVSGNVLGLRRPARKSRGHRQVLASHHPMTPDAAPWHGGSPHGGSPPGDTTFTSGKYMPNVSMGPQFWSSFSDFFLWKYILNYYLSLCLLSKQSRVCLFTCQISMTTEEIINCLITKTSHFWQIMKTLQKYWSKWLMTDTLIIFF